MLMMMMMIRILELRQFQFQSQSKSASAHNFSPFLSSTSNDDGGAKTMKYMVEFGVALDYTITH